jgi:MinD superfamily P-loop ATPase
MKKEYPERIRKIAITGGKGGTGKSTVAILLANEYFRAGEKIILVDCDVECPNDYLLLGQELKTPLEKIYTPFPELDENKCQKCGRCLKACRSNAIFQAPGQYPVFIKDLCSGCGACWLVCPNQAIRPVKEETGQIFLNQLKENYWLITGLAKAGLEETGPIVTQTKKFALKFASQQKADLVLLDTAAGTHCPVISALLNADLAYAVTEPTPMGAVDLGLIFDLGKKLKVPIEVILNQADLGDKKRIAKVTQKYQAAIVREIPYSQKIVQAYSRGKLLNFNYLDEKI